MKKTFYIILILLLFNCKSVADWKSAPVLNNSTVEMAKTYVREQTYYNQLIEERNSLDIKDNLSVYELNKVLEIEKSIALSARKVVSSWFDFNLELKQDIGFDKAYSGHYYFRTGLDAIDYSNGMSSTKEVKTLNDKLSLERINHLVGLCRLAVGELVAFNETLLTPEKYKKEIKYLYKSMD